VRNGGPTNLGCTRGTGLDFIPTVMGTLLLRAIAICRETRRLVLVIGHLGQHCVSPITTCEYTLPTYFESRLLDRLLTLRLI